MELIIISNPDYSEHEFENINLMFEHGMECFHIRKPDYTENQLSQVLLNIASEFRSRIVLHDHYSLVYKYNLKGIHLTSKFKSRNPWSVVNEVISTAKNNNKTLSTTAHTTDELMKLYDPYDYVFLSPVFDSISKTFHKSAINLADVKIILKKKPYEFKVIAQGGIDENNIAEVKKAGFDGVSILGALWKSSDLICKYESLKNKMNAGN